MNKKAAEVLLTTCSECRKEERILFVTDPSSVEVAKIMWDSTQDYPNKTLIMMNERTMHGEDPPETVAVAMKNADVIFGCTKFSLFHSKSRKDAVGNGARFINMVDYSTKMMEEGGLYCDFEEVGKICKTIAAILDNKKICKITTAKGTEFVCSIEGRKPIPQYGRSLQAGVSSSPPDVECATCAVEETAEGIIYIDGSIPHPELGLITDEIKLTIKKGTIIAIEGGPQAKILEQVLRGFNDPNIYKIGEIGLGLNPMCKLNGRMLEDEGCGGTVHFGFGDNRGFGGVIESKYHLDMIFKNPTLEADGITVLRDGSIVLDQKL